MELKEIESAIEGVLFAAGEPVGVERLCLALDIDRITADSVCQRLADAYRYERRASAWCGWTTAISFALRRSLPTASAGRLRVGGPPA